MRAILQSTMFPVGCARWHGMCLMCHCYVARECVCANVSEMKVEIALCLVNRYIRCMNRTHPFGFCNRKKECLCNVSQVIIIVMTLPEVILLISYVAHKILLLPLLKHIISENGIF